MNWSELIRDHLFQFVSDMNEEKKKPFQEYEEVETTPLMGEANSKIIHRPKTEKLFKNL